VTVGDALVTARAVSGSLLINRFRIQVPAGAPQKHRRSTDQEVRLNYDFVGSNTNLINLSTMTEEKPSSAYPDPMRSPLAPLGSAGALS
jgi:hypothetical protein